jgi:hypothetical protein
VWQVIDNEDATNNVKWKALLPSALREVINERVRFVCQIEMPLAN